MLWDVFVSHNKREKPWVREFVVHLRAAGLNVFFDEDTIGAGAEFQREITAALSESRVIALIISAASMASPWVAGEVDTALHYAASRRDQVTVIPIFLDEVAVEHPGLVQRSAVYLTDSAQRDSAYRRLVGELLALSKKTQLEQLPPLPPWPDIGHPARSLTMSSGGRAIAIGSHWDDILLGCLGTLVRLKVCYDYQVSVSVLCTAYADRYFGHPQPHLNSKTNRLYEELSRRFAIKYLAPEQNVLPIFDRGFRDKEDLVSARVEELAHRCRDYDLIFTPPSDDAHADHSITGRLVNANFRQPHQTILDYEIKRYTDRTFVPNIFVNLDSDSSNGVPVGSIKVEMLSQMVVHGRNQADEDIGTKIEGSDFVFGERSLEARLLINALDYSGDKTIKHGEVFRGRVSI
jgi:LmbE family N-acetylglucosaminyl deacetylase